MRRVGVWVTLNLLPVHSHLASVIKETCCSGDWTDPQASDQLLPSARMLLTTYRACVRAHKLALQAQRGFWHCLLRDKVAFRDLQVCFESMEAAEKQATGVYRR